MKNKVGEIRKSNQCGLMEIVEYNNAFNIKVKFKTGSIVKARYDNFKRGNVKDPLFPIVYKIGYFGIGKYKARINSKITTEYQTWRSMIQRCYDPYTINKYSTYQDVIVCKEWLNFQNFAEWFHKNYYELVDEGVQLDKDLIKRNNKIYCPEYCSFVPKSINTLVVKSDKARGKYPVGVYFDKQSNKYKSQIVINRKKKNLGRFATSLKAFQSYKVEKEKQIKIITNKYKEVLDIKVYKYLMHYEVLIND